MTGIVFALFGCFHGGVVTLPPPFLSMLVPAEAEWNLLGCSSDWAGMVEKTPNYFFLLYLAE